MLRDLTNDIHPVPRSISNSLQKATAGWSDMAVEIVADTLQAVSSYITPAISLFLGQIWFFLQDAGCEKGFHCSN